MDKFTESDIYVAWPNYYMDYFLEILNGEYTVESAREDLRGLLDAKKLEKREGNFYR